MSVILDEFLRRYATSPIHVPRLERLLATYGGRAPEAFAAAFIEWDRACPHADAARIASELLSAHCDASGELIRVADETIQSAMAALLDAGPVDLRETLRQRLFRSANPAT